MSGVSALHQRPETAQTRSILPTYILESGFSSVAEGLGVSESLK